MKKTITLAAIVLCLTTNSLIVSAADTNSTNDAINDAFGQTVIDNINETGTQIANDQSVLGNFDTSQFVKKFNSFSDFSSKMAFDVPNLDELGDTSSLNYRYGLLTENLKSNGYGQKVTLDTSDKIGYSRNSMSVFKDTFGNVYDNINITTSQIPSDFTVNSILDFGKQERDKAFAEKKITDLYKQTHDLTSFKTIFEESDKIIAEDYQKSFNIDSINNRIAAGNEAVDGYFDEKVSGYTSVYEHNKGAAIGRASETQKNLQTTYLFGGTFTDSEGNEQETPGIYSAFFSKDAMWTEKHSNFEKNNEQTISDWYDLWAYANGVTMVDGYENDGETNGGRHR